MVNISDRWNRDQDRRPAIRFFQRRGLGELGKHLGHLERDHAARCRSDPARGDDGTRTRAVSRERATGSRSRQCCVLESSRAAGRSAIKRSGRSSIATSTTSTGPQMELPAADGMRYFDLYHGVELQPTRDGDKITSQLCDRRTKITARSSQRKPHPMRQIAALMAQMKIADGEAALSVFPNEWKFLPQHLVEIAATKPVRNRAPRHDQNSRRHVQFPRPRNRDRRQQRHRRRYANAVGRFAAPLPRARPRDEAVLDRQISGDERASSNNFSTRRTIIRKTT